MQHCWFLNSNFLIKINISVKLTNANNALWKEIKYSYNTLKYGKTTFGYQKILL